MRYIIDQEGQKLTGVIISSAWLALKTRNFYSLSVLWGVLGPKVFFAKVPNTPGYTTDFSSVLCSSPSLIPSTDGILIGKSRHALTRSCCSTILLFYGPAVLRSCCSTGLPLPYKPICQFAHQHAFQPHFHGYVYRWHPVWWRKYKYLLAVGLDCGTQLMQTVQVLGINLPNKTFPSWWGNNADQIDHCFPSAELPPNALN